MKRSFFIILLALLTSLPSFGQATKRERNLIKQGNEYFNKKNYNKAEECYSRVLEFNPNSQIAKYNLGTSWLRQRGSNSEKANARDSIASQYLNDVGSNPNAPASLRAHSFYNLGKLAYDKQDYASSVDFFKKSLKVNPKDEQARKNLRMAQKKLQQNNKNNQNKNNDKKDDKKQDNDKQQPPQQQPQPPKEQQPQTNKDQLLKAMQNEEKNTRDKVNRRKAQIGEHRQSNRPW